MQNYTISEEHKAILFLIFQNAGYTVDGVSLNDYKLDGGTVHLFINDRQQEQAVPVEIPAWMLWDAVDESGYNGYQHDHYNQHGIDHTTDETITASTYFDETSEAERVYFCTVLMNQVLDGSEDTVKNRRAA